jgi:hypothetical protein
VNSLFPSLPQGSGSDGDYIGRYCEQQVGTTLIFSHPVFLKIALEYSEGSSPRGNGGGHTATATLSRRASKVFITPL